MIKQQKTRKMVADIIVAILATSISSVCFEAGLLIALVWAMIPFFKESATQQERANGCKDVVFTILIAMIPNLLLGLLLQMVWILLPEEDD